MKEYTLRIKQKHEAYYGTPYYAVQRKYWIFWISVASFSTEEEANSFDYCKALRIKALEKNNLRLLQIPKKVSCECSNYKEQ